MKVVLRHVFIKMRILWHSPIAAATTGVTLLWLLKQPQPAEDVETWTVS